jgi:hypothetical protein
MRMQSVEDDGLLIFHARFVEDNIVALSSTQDHPEGAANASRREAAQASYLLKPAWRSSRQELSSSIQPSQAGGVWGRVSSYSRFSIRKISLHSLYLAAIVAAQKFCPTMKSFPTYYTEDRHVQAATHSKTSNRLDRWCFDRNFGF